MKTTKVSVLVAVLFSLVFALTGCKKQRSIKEEITVTGTFSYYISCISEQNYIRKPGGGYDTLVSLLNPQMFRIYSKSLYFEDLRVQTTCNNFPMCSNMKDIANKMAPFYPVSHWKTICLMDPDANYNVIDTSALPKVSNLNWFTKDSISSTENLVLDFSSFSQYSSIKVKFGRMDTILKPSSSLLTIPSYCFAYASEPGSEKPALLLSIYVCNENYMNVSSNKAAMFTKAISFQYGIKVFR